MGLKIVYGPFVALVLKAQTFSFFLSHPSDRAKIVKCKCTHLDFGSQSIASPHSIQEYLDGQRYKAYKKK